MNTTNHASKSLKTVYRCFASITPGLELLLESELRSLGFGLKNKVELGSGGIELSLYQDQLWKLCRSSRLAEGLLVRIGKPFMAHNFQTLIEKTKNQAWAAFIARQSIEPQIKVHCKKSKLYHSQAVAERIRNALVARLQLKTPSDNQDEYRPTIHARIISNQVQLSLDASGRLHKRGYRQFVGDAPIRETLAAAVLQLAEINSYRSFWDPFCGSGTFTIEAALAQASNQTYFNQAPSYPFEAWPSHNKNEYDKIFDANMPNVFSSTFVGSDNDPSAIEIAQKNALSAKLEGYTSFHQLSISELATKIPNDSLIVTNPPYGERIGTDLKKLKQTYRDLNLLLAKRPDLRAFVITANSNLLINQKDSCNWNKIIDFNNRGLRVGVYTVQR